MIQYQFLFFLLGIVQSKSLRGLNPTLTSLYQPVDGNFKCLDSSLIIDFERVNDDFCDCRDGSDEPGSSACPDNIFYCPNYPHLPKNITSSKVDDGICDCCDGSDERSLCPNTCRIIHEKFEAERQRLSKSLAEAKIAAETFVKENVAIIIQNATRSADQAKTTIQELQKHKESVNATLTILRNSLSELEKKFSPPETNNSSESNDTLQDDAHHQQDEKIAKVFNLFDMNKDGSLDKIELWDSHAQRISYVDEVKEWVKNGPIGFVEFTRLWKMQIALEQAEETNEEEEELEAEKRNKPIESDSEKFPDDEETPEGEDEKEDKSYESNNVQENPQNEAPEDPHSQSPEEHAEIKSLKSEIDSLKKIEDDLSHKINLEERTLRDFEKVTTIDFGPDKVYLMLYKKCFDLLSSEYTYRFCPFNDVHQNPRGESKMGVLLGKWEKWQDPSTMIFSNGQHCWNGPNRSIRVSMQCGEENAILKVSEPSRCAYKMIFSTPAACYQLPDETIQTHIENSVHLHTEL